MNNIATSKKENEPADKKQHSNYEDEIFLRSTAEPEELESDGSASAFDETERVTEDNFDNLSEK